MQFALVDNERTAAAPGLTGTCPSCGSAMVAKCGPLRINHWAHRGVRDCDSWAEPETPWHRTWKNQYPTAWQECPQHDQHGEKHIADVRTEHGLVIEFQHSHLKPEERVARERFYGNMVWVVDGARLKRDLPRFVEGIQSVRRLPNGRYLTAFPDELFPPSWLSCNLPVFFDFANRTDLAEEARHVSHLLWCLLPGRVRGYAVVLAVSREGFVRLTHKEGRLIEPAIVLQDVARALAERQASAHMASLRETMLMRQGWRQRSRRRYARF
jgi:Competence protein CoiA-like family